MSILIVAVTPSLMGKINHEIKYLSTFCTHILCEMWIQKLDMLKLLIHMIRFKKDIGLRWTILLDILCLVQQLDKFMQGHIGARNTLLQLYEKYGSDVVKIYGGSDQNLTIGEGVSQKKTIMFGGSVVNLYQYDFEYIKKEIERDSFEIDEMRYSIQEAYLRGNIDEKQKLELEGKKPK